ncbi:DegV family protein [Ectobacillus ponti]|uniref:DegV family protein n=1 Tax=Ectobacillus ponti TaxID=2961894 RepID=A0AA41X3T9_9BACI|nr:DegV family protein [Ectobacillus ponti]MCP8968162.1 DegV family protein [Ectobacillus ponti]
MEKLAWVIDSTAYVSEEVKQHPDIFVVPLAVMFGDEVYEDGVTIDEHALYTKIREQQAVPTTSQPAIGVFVDLYEQLKENYDAVIMLHVSQRLSGTYNASRQAAEMTGLQYHCIDTMVLSAGTTYLLEEGLYLAGQGCRAAEIVQRLEAILPSLEDYILIGNLAQLHRGGRLSNAQYVIGTLLNIKPILQVRDGLVEVYGKVRYEKKAVKLLLDKCREALSQHDIRKLAVIHGNRPEAAAQWREQILAMKPGLRVDLVPLPSVLGAHAGEGTLAVMWYNASLEG